MRSFNKYFIYLAALLIVIIAGYFTGKHFSTPKPQLSAEEELQRQEHIQEQRDAKQAQRNAKAEYKKQERAFKRADYLAATPSFGPLIKIQSIAVTYQEDAASGFLTADQAQNIERGQKIVLYDREGFTLPLGGKVADIEEQEDASYKITVALPEGTNTQYLLNGLDIITLETIASKRLPLSALQTDDSGETYIWLMHKDEDENAKTFKVTRQYIEKGQFDDNFFEESGHIIEAFDLVVLNPNAKTRSDQKYKIFITEIEAPLHNPTRQAWIDYELYRLAEDQARLIQRAEDCANGITQKLPPKAGDTTLSDGSTENSQILQSCGGSVGDTVRPIDIFNSLINQGQ